MKKTLLPVEWYLIKMILLLILFSGCKPVHIISYTQTSEKFKSRYKSSLEKDEREINSWYHYVTTSNSKGEYIIRTFFPETNQITSYTTYVSSKNLLKNGSSISWNDNGNKRFEGNYKLGKKDGIWKYYYHDISQVRSVGNYQKGQETGIWKKYHENGSLKSYYNYVKGKKEGEFEEYDSLENVLVKGICKGDTIYSSNDPAHFVKKEELPLFKDCKGISSSEKLVCSNIEMSKYLQRNLNYPQEARYFQVEGTAYVSFSVDKDGNAKDIEVISGLCKSIAVECKRIITSMPRWEKPGSQNGESVEVKLTLPIKFKLK